MADTASKDKAKKPAKAKAPAAPKAPETPTALVSTFPSHGQTYTILRISREVGSQLKKGARYDVKIAGDGVITLKPQA
jgi:hypothetical protein